MGLEVGSIGLMPLIETALGLENSFAIASASKRIKAMLLGAEDLTADLQCTRTKEGKEIEYARGRIVVAARASGIDVYETPFTDVNDDEGIITDTRFAKSLGFTGKASISPRHIEVINQIFSPTQAEIDYAFEVIDAITLAKEQGKGAIALRGKMIDAPIVAHAERTITAAKFLKDIMLKKQIAGSFGLGGITGYMVDMLKSGCFKELLDVQCFDLNAVESIRENPNHKEISAIEYASPNNPNAAVNNLDVVILGATEIDTDFNVNVHTDSNGFMMGGSGGHSDTAAGSKLSMIIAPMFRARLPIVTDRVTCISTPGKDIDVLVTQGGIAVNPKNQELHQRLIDAKLPVIDIFDLKKKVENITGVPNKLPKGDRQVATIIGRNGDILDNIYNVI